MGRAYVRFGLENPEHYRIMFMTRPLAEGLPLDRLPGLTAFGYLVEAVARCMDAGAIAAGDPFLVATNLWTAVHGITSLLIARPDFPWPDLDRLMGLVSRSRARVCRPDGAAGAPPGADAPLDPGAGRRRVGGRQPAGAPPGLVRAGPAADVLHPRRAPPHRPAAGAGRRRHPVARPAGNAS